MKMGYISTGNSGPRIYDLSCFIYVHIVPDVSNCDFIQLKLFRWVCTALCDCEYVSVQFYLSRKFTFRIMITENKTNVCKYSAL